jgi:hypothetical protein
MNKNITAEKVTGITTAILVITHRPVFYLKLDDSEIGFCLRQQVEPTQLGPKERTSLRWANLSRFHLTTETESSLRNFMFLITYHRHKPIYLKLQVQRMFETELLVAELEGWSH